MKAARIAVLLAVGVSFAQRASAQEISDLQALLSEQVVTSASKQAEGASSAPALSTNLSADDLRRYGIRTLAEAIDFLSLGLASSDNLDGGEIGARGVLLTGDRGSHVLLLVDGHAMNDQVRGSAWFGVGAGIPLELIDHIEVIVGPGSVLYGSNAMLGLINVVTKRAKDYSSVRLIAESSLATAYRAAAGIGERFTLFGQESELTGQVEYYKQTGPDFYIAPENTGIDAFTKNPGRYTRSPQGTGVWGGGDASSALYAEAPSAVMRLAVGDTEIDLRGSYYRHGAPTGSGNFDDPATGETESRASFDVKHRRSISNLLKISGRIYGDYYDQKGAFVTSLGSQCPFQGSVTCNYANAATGLWGGLDLQTTWDWVSGGRFVTVLGADLRKRSIEASGSTTNIDSGIALYPPGRGLDFTDNTLGAYLQQTWSVTDTFKLNGGGRVDRDPRFAPVLTPRLAANWNAWTGGTVKAAYAEAFRAPSYDESANASSGRVVAAKMDPEKVRSIEGSVQQQFGPHRMILGAFYSQWSNLVELRTLSDAETIDAIRNGQTTVPFTPGVRLTQYSNVASLRNYGFNTGFEGTLGYERFQYGFNLTIAVADETEGTQSAGRLPVAPRLFGNARVAYVPGGNVPTVSLATHFMGDRLADVGTDAGFRPTPYAPAQAELRFTVTGPAPLLKGLSYRVFANYAVSDRGPYVIGPVTAALPTQRTAQLIPVDRFHTTVSLQYEF